VTVPVPVPVEEAVGALLDKDDVAWCSCGCDSDCGDDVLAIPDARLRAVVGRLMLLAAAGLGRCRLRGSIARGDDAEDGDACFAPRRP
jgi:hypothetical protein